MAERKMTMKDVAVEAGVSTATVGRVLHRRGYVSEMSRLAVERAIQKTGFRLNMVAQSLRRSQSMAIGHLLNSLVPNPFYAGIEQGVEQEAIRHGYDVLVWNVLSDPQREREGVETFIRRQMDAIIFTTPVDQANVALAREAAIPVIQVERPLNPESHLVLVDNYGGAVSAMEHLIGLGHERIAFIGRQLPGKISPDLVVDVQRLDGWRDTLRKHMLKPQEQWFAEADLYSIQDGFRATMKFLALKPRITAIFAACDILAAGALQAIYQRGLRVPEDISVIGFDDTYAPFLTPPLTSVHQPVYEIGVQAADLGIQLAQNPGGDDFPFQTRRLATQLVIRSSTGLPSGDGLARKEEEKARTNNPEA